MKKIALALLYAASSAAAWGQAAPSDPLVIADPQAAPATFLPANTEITVAMNDSITSKGKKFNEGDTFDLTVTHDVKLGQYVIIPRGARGVGRITWMTSKGMFGKSGKMEIDIEYVEVSGRQIPVKGHFRQEGEGNTVATVGTVLLAGVFGALVTGKSALIPAGRELKVHTKDDLPVTLPGPLTTGPAPLAAQPVKGSEAPTPSPTPAEIGDGGLKPGARVKCLTCN